MANIHVQPENARLILQGDAAKLLPAATVSLSIVLAAEYYDSLFAYWRLKSRKEREIKKIMGEEDVGYFKAKNQVDTLMREEKQRLATLHNINVEAVLKSNKWSHFNRFIYTRRNVFAAQMF